MHDHAEHTPLLATRHDDLGGRQAVQRRLLAVLGLTTAFLVVEALGGILTNSLALLADAGHMLSDVGALALALLANWYASRPPTVRQTYGRVRAEVLAALINGIMLVAVAVFILKEAFDRLGEPPEVHGEAALLVALAGLVANLASAALLRQGSGHGLNERGVLLHVISDALGSVGAIASGAIIWLSGWNTADPLVSILIAALVLFSSISLLRATFSVLMEAAPVGLDAKTVESAMTAAPGVASVHDLHVWTVTSGFPALSAHVQSAGRPSSDVLHDLRTLLRARFGLEHVTLQVESCEHPRDTACCELDPRCLPPTSAGRRAS
jgi:cobalt-zinc-cadmium efflux system protein